MIGAWFEIFQKKHEPKVDLQNSHVTNICNGKHITKLFPSYENKHENMHLSSTNGRSFHPTMLDSRIWYPSMGSILCFFLRFGRQGAVGLVLLSFLGKPLEPDGAGERFTEFSHPEFFSPN